MASKFVTETEDLLKRMNEGAPPTVVAPPSMWERAKVGLGNVAQAVQGVVGLGGASAQEAPDNRDAVSQMFAGPGKVLLDRRDEEMKRMTGVLR